MSTVCLLSGRSVSALSGCDGSAAALTRLPMGQSDGLTGALSLLLSGKVEHELPAGRAPGQGTVGGSDPGDIDVTAEDLCFGVPPLMVVLLCSL